MPCQNSGDGNARAALLAAVKRIHDLTCGTASVILMPGRETLDDACVSAVVITHAQEAMPVIDSLPAILDAALAEARAEQQRRDAETIRGLTRVDDRLEAGYECGWNAACAAGMAAIERGEDNRG